MPTGVLGQTGLIQADLFTGEYRISGQVTVGTSGLYTVLSNRDTDYLEIQSAYISRIHQPGEIIANYKLCAFRKENINFILLSNRRDGLPMGQQPRRSLYRGRPTESLMTVPAFEIRGEVIVEGKFSPSAVLLQGNTRYQFVYEATASATLHPDISYKGDLILVDSRQIGIFCLKGA